MDKETIRRRALGLGADCFGAADLAPFRGDITDPPGLLAPYRTALSMGAALSRDIVNACTDGPTPMYARHYQVVNDRLDRIAYDLTRILQAEGARALPVPASQVLDRKDWRGAFSHKAAARMAGLGWQGKSLLLINPEAGPRLRLVTVLTDLELEPDRPLEARCGRCTECVEACPAGAVKGTDFGEGYPDRAAAWDAERCTTLLVNGYGRRPYLDENSLICGVCIQACPVGRGPG